MADIAVATWSVRHALKDESIGFEGVADFLNENNINFIEINNRFTTPKELPGVIDLFEEYGISTFQLTVDGNNFFQKKEKKRKEQFDFMKKWIDPASKKGVKYIRANMGRRLGFFRRSDKIENLLATFHPIMQYIESKGMTFVFENHGGKSSDVEFQLKVKNEIPSEHFGYLLDMGNYRPKEEVYENIMKLGDAIKVVHAKAYGFDEQG